MQPENFFSQIEKLPNSPIDSGQLKETVYEGSPESARNLVAFFLRAFPRNLSKMRKEIKSADRKVLAIVAHGCRGSSLIVGAKRLAEISGKLEEDALREPPVDLNKRLMQLTLEFKKTKDDLSPLLTKDKKAA